METCHIAITPPGVFPTNQVAEKNSSVGGVSRSFLVVFLNGVWQVGLASLS